MTDNSIPCLLIIVLTAAENLQLVVFERLNLGSQFSNEHIDHVIGFELFLQSADHFEHGAQLLFSLDLFFRIQTVITIAAIILRIFLAEIMKEHLSTANGCLGISSRFQQELFSDFLFSNGFSLHKLLQFLQILVGIKSDALAFAAIASCTSRLLIITFEALGNIVMNHITYIGFINTHTESDGCHNHIHLFHQERVLIGRADSRIHSGMVSQGFDTIRLQDVCKLLDLLAAQTINDAGFPFVGLDEFDDFAVNIRSFRANLIIKIGTIERGLKDARVNHPKIFLNIVLNFRRCRSSQRDKRTFSDFIDDRTNTTVFGSEVMSPFGDTMSLIDCIKGNLDIP